MTSSTPTAENSKLNRTPTLPTLRWKRLLVALVLLALALAPGKLGELTRELMVDAYTAVAAFVAGTLLLFYGAERVFKFRIGNVLSKAKGWQVPIASLMGATPGCGGAVVVVAAYSSGHVSFGAVVAALTATMGDAAFLLIATKPEAAAVVLPLSFAIGILSGWLIDKMPIPEMRAPAGGACELAPLIGRTRPQDMAYFALALPGLAIGIMDLMTIDTGALFGALVPTIALAGTFLGLSIWVTSKLTAMTHEDDSPITRMAEETSFIAVWVIGAFLAYDYLVEFGGLDLEALFATVAPLLPLMGVLVGLIPGCGPQILVTTLYVNGLIPFAAVLGNAISNDGDALFPAIALNPKAAIWATLYSAIPALIVSYGVYYAFPSFLN